MSVVTIGAYCGWVSAALVFAFIAVGSAVADRFIRGIARRYGAFPYGLPLVVSALLTCAGLASLAVPGLTLFQRLLVTVSCSGGFLLGGAIAEGLKPASRRQRRSRRGSGT